MEGFAPREPDDWGRTNNQHWYDPKAFALLIDSRLRQPLEDCFEDDVEGIQTMYFYKGSEGRRHQDQCPATRLYVRLATFGRCQRSKMAPSIYSPVRIKGNL